MPALVCILLSLPNSFRPVLCLMVSTIVLRLSDIVLRSVYFNDEITWYSIFHVCMMIIQ